MMKRKVTLIAISFFFSVFTLQSQTWFGPQQILISDSLATYWARSVYSADIDGDGDLDVLSASARDDKIAWYENKDGKGTFGIQQVITTTANFAVSVFATDIDGDGDMDVLSASREDGIIAWYKNVNGNGSLWIKYVITTSAYNASSVYAADLDGDGDMDVLSSSDFNSNCVAWYENTNGTGGFGPRIIIPDGVSPANSITASDMDGDGDLDIVAASFSEIAWYENTDGGGTFEVSHVLDDYWHSGARSFFAIDIDGDEDVDIFAASDRNIAWYENLDGSGTFGPKQIILVIDYDDIRSLYAADIDGDGDVDLLTASSSKNSITWFENKDGDGTFGVQQDITTNAFGAVAVFASDIDNDGDQDVLSASRLDNNITWYNNTDGNGTFSSDQYISASAKDAYCVFSIDIDNDGDMDVLSASSSQSDIAWYENLDGNGDFGTAQRISKMKKGSFSVFAADIDNDGDQDVLAAVFGMEKLTWYENIDGNGTFGPQNIIQSSLEATAVFATDFDGDGDVDVVAAAAGRPLSGLHSVTWYENTNGMGDFGTQQIIVENTISAFTVYAADIDGDGEMDVISKNGDRQGVAWYENTDGNGTFGPPRIINVEDYYIELHSIHAEDLDNDGDIDVLFGYKTSQGYQTVSAWQENLDGKGTFGPKKSINTKCNYVYATDLDGDGDMDVLSASVGRNIIAWNENIDGKGTFGELQMISTKVDYAKSVYAADLDGDGDMDVLSASALDGKIAWYENMTIIGIETTPQNEIAAYPNPTTGKITLDFAEDEILQLKIIDLSGKIQIEITEVQPGKSIDLSDLPGGIYILSIQTKKEIITRKIIKE